MEWALLKDCSISKGNPSKNSKAKEAEEKRCHQVGHQTAEVIRYKERGAIGWFMHD
jgi:hypothetical protein